MPTTDTTERGLEQRITYMLTATREDSSMAWLLGHPTDYDQEYCVDLAQLGTFLSQTQPETATSLALIDDNPTRRQFLTRLKRETGSRGIIDVLRKDIQHRQHSITFFYGTPSPGNEAATERYTQNRFSVTRQLRYSRDQRGLALDLVLFINGLPLATFELKNNLTKQTVLDAVEQYRRDRSPREDLFRPGRCAVHFAVDEQEVKFCTQLKGKYSEFLPFNKGHEGGAGNPVNPSGLKTDYLWQDILAPESLTNIIENYAQRVGKADVWPRFHQLDVVRRLLADATNKGVGPSYLIQHSAGSGKSNSIAWLARQLIGIAREGQPLFDSIIVVTDRLVLDNQIHATIRQFTQVNATVGHANSSSDLRQFIAEGKKVIITTVQKFPFILDAISAEHRGSHFAIIIDEAHSSQGGKAAAAMNVTLGSSIYDEDEDTFEDQINHIIESRRRLPNASYFAFTATPKNKTLQLFGTPDPQVDSIRHWPFHSYTMKQAIQEGFILDVLGHYTTVQSYFNLVKKIEDDPEFDGRRAQRRLRHYVEGHQYAIDRKAKIMVDHFQESVFWPRKINGRARAMVVTDGVQLAIDYYHAIQECIAQRGLPFQVLVAFSGEREYRGRNVSEATLNGFPSSRITERIQEDPYRILVCADKFQTGYDEPLLHTMYVDKHLAGIKAVQTLSRLNRACPGKSDTFILDFKNSTDTIQKAFADYYRTTILADETDPNKLHDLKATLDHSQVYTPQQVDQLVQNYLDGSDRSVLDPVLDSCLEPYGALDEDGQVNFKGSARAFIRLYTFLAQVLPYSSVEWEKLSIFLNFLIPRLPAPDVDDFAIGILEVVDMDSYRTEKKAIQRISLADEDAEIDPVPGGIGGHMVETEMEPLSRIVAEFNQLWGGDFTDADRVAEFVKAIPEQVIKDPAYQNAMQNSDRQNAQIEHDAALRRLITTGIRSSTEMYKAYTENIDFQSWLNTMIFDLTYLTPLSQGSE